MHQLSSSKLHTSAHLLAALALTSCTQDDRTYVERNEGAGGQEVDGGAGNAVGGRGGTSASGGATPRATTSSIGPSSSGGTAATSSAQGGASTAGSSTSNGGSTSSGGTTTSGATTSGGSSAKGGSTSSGGTTTSGATTSGGSSAKGGSTSAGGSTSSGGSSAKGGSTSAGGTSATGGTTASSTGPVACTNNTPCGTGECVAGYCRRYPDLSIVDGYIHPEGNGTNPRYLITFANAGVATSGGYCCAATPAEARAAYPGKNLALLTPLPVITAGSIPLLNGVTGYIIYDSIQGKYRIDTAVNGELTGTSASGWTTVDAARAAFPSANLVYVSGL